MSSLPKKKKQLDQKNGEKNPMIISIDLNYNVIFYVIQIKINSLILKMFSKKKRLALKRPIWNHN